MKKISQNSFSKGLNMDLNPLSTPKDVLTDCLNGTVITYNGDEFSLQTDMGNSRATVIGDGSTTDLPNGFIPLGMKEFNNILYIVAHNPITKESKVGSFPAPQRYLPMINGTGDNMEIKTLYGITGTSIQELTNNLTVTGNINHNMNLLNTFLKRGDKYKVSLTLKGINNWATADDILKKFINNYPTEANTEGYFDLKYYSFNADGILSELPIDIYPTNNISDIAYTPNPFNNNAASNGITKVMETDGNNVIVAAFIPKSITSFDFNLLGYNKAGILKAKIVFDPALIKDSNSAIKVETIKINVKIIPPDSLALEEFIKYYDYKLYKTSSQVVIIEQVSGITFKEGTLITITCTPMDQFARELTDKTITKTYTVTSALSGVDAHNLFNYNIVGDALTLNYNFLNLPGITQTQVEFFDFWSGVSILTVPIDFNMGTREVTMNNQTLNYSPKDTIFMEGIRYGGIFDMYTRLPTANEHIMGKRISNAGLRKDHCYLVRIFGKDKDEDIEYSVFQLLYTTSIPTLLNQYGSERNFGKIDIVDGLLNNSLSISVTGLIFKVLPVINVLTNPVLKGSTSNYNNPINGDVLEPYRLYGGPVMEEEKDGFTASWDIKIKDLYYRNIYTGEFAKLDALSILGYHNFPESSVDLLLAIPAVNGNAFPSGLFINQSKGYLQGGLHSPNNSSQEDFKFNLSSYISATSPTIQGTVTINPTNLTGIPLFFGNIDMSILSKELIIGSRLNKLGTVTSLPPFTENLSWSDGLEHIQTVDNTASYKANISSSDKEDTLTISDFSLQTQRFIYADSSFKYYVRKFTRNKLFRYFSLKHTQTMRVKVVLNADYTNLVKHTNYLFHGGADTNPNVYINSTNGTPLFGMSTTYDITIDPDFKPTLIWKSDIITSKLSDAIAGMGVTTIIPLVPPIGFNAVAFKNGSCIIKFLTYIAGNTDEQYMYKTFKTSSPSHLKIGLSNAGAPLYSNNNLWLWNDFSFPYVAVNNTISDEYLNKLILAQNYQEVIVAQYPKNNIVYNIDSTSNVTVTNNSLKYSIEVDLSAEEKYRHLTKSCFGKPDMEAFNRAKFSLMIDNWKKGQGELVKIVYDFTNIALSEGNAVNIPWTFTNRTLSTVPIANFGVSLTAATLDEHINLFTTAENTMDSSKYLRSSDNYTPTIKAITKDGLLPIKTSYIVTQPLVASKSINRIDMEIPAFNKSLLLTRSQVISGSYDIKYKLVEPLTVDEIYRGPNIVLGQRFGGGVVFQINRNADKIITGGLIAIDPILWVRISGIMYASWLGSNAYTTAADSMSDGTYNTGKLLANDHSRGSAVLFATQYRGGNYTDWYLPAFDELHNLGAYSAATGDSILPAGGKIWSSTEKNGDNAYVYYVDSPYSKSYVDKQDYGDIYPIRKF